MDKAFSYVRFSTPEQERGDSFRRQKALAEEFAARKGLELDERSFQDLGVSAFRGANAATGMLAEFLTLVRAGGISRGSYLLVESLDRLSRNVARKAVRVLEDICAEGITVVTLADGKVYDEATLDAEPMAFMWAFMVAIRANEESAMKSRRGKAAWENKRAKANERPLTARAPYWLRLNRQAAAFEVIEERAVVVRRIFRMALDGIGQHKIAETLNRENVPCFGSGRHWHRSYVAKLLQNAAVMGTFTPHSVEYVGGKRNRNPAEPVGNYFPPIVDLPTFEHVQAMARSAASPLRGRHAASGTVSNILGGIGRCPVCGGTMTRVNKGKGNGRSYLVCAAAKVGGGCRYRAVPYKTVEEMFLADAARVIDDVPAGSGRTDIDDELEAVMEKMVGISDNIENVLQAIRRGEASTRERKLLRDLETEMEQLQQARADLVQKRSEIAGPLVEQRVNALKAALQATSFDRTRVNVLLRQLLSAAVIDYRVGQLVLKWKHGGETEVMIGWPEDEYVKDFEVTRPN